MDELLQELALLKNRIYDLELRHARHKHLGDVDQTQKLASTATSPGGSNQQVQFNDNGVFGGDANLTFDKGNGSYANVLLRDGSAEVFIESGTDSADSAGSAHTEVDFYRTIPVTVGSGNPIFLDGFSELRTTSATPVTVSSDTFGAIVGGAGLIEARIIGVQTAGSGTIGDIGVYVRRAAYKYTGGVLSLMGAIVDVFTYEDNAAWDATFSISANFPLVKVTGEASKTINWTVQCYLLQI